MNAAFLMPYTPQSKGMQRAVTVFVCLFRESFHASLSK